MTNNGKLCPHCGQPMPTVDEAEVQQNIKYRPFKEFEYNSYMLNDLKGTLDTMTDDDRMLVLDAMLTAKHNDGKLFAGDFQIIQEFHRKYCYEQ